jgi:hypothetical protein
MSRRQNRMKEKLICALLFGEAETKLKVEQIAESYQSCPYIHLMATKGKRLFATLFLPERQRWWAEYIEKNPRKTFGLERAKVTFPDNIQYPEQLTMRLPKKPLETSPCGAQCKTCPANDKCLCCPATIYRKYNP